MPIYCYPMKSSIIPKVIKALNARSKEIKNHDVLPCGLTARKKRRLLEDAQGTNEPSEVHATMQVQVLIFG